jgi:hypothetical protein
MRNALWLLILGGCSTAVSPREVVEHLSSDALQGRQVGIDGERAAAEYVAKQLARYGLSPDVREFAAGGAGTSRNVIAVVPGSSKEAVVIGAHLDHLGAKGKDIYRGADDNASGVAALVAIAGRFAKSPAKRSIILIAFGGEEAGILGSRAYVRDPLAGYEAVAMLNMDMVGRMKERALLCIGVDTSDVWDRVLTDANTMKLDVKVGKGGVGPSDHTSFYQAGLPVLHFFTGAHADYHQPGDTAEKINYDGLALVVDFVEAVARRVADSPVKPNYVKTEGGIEAKPAPGARPYFGAMPDYQFSDRMQVEGVAPGSPAEKAGLKQGDVIVAMDGVDVKDLQDYADRLFACKVGQEVLLKVRRGDGVLEMRVTLAARKRP